jgi:collagenase-like PrtC family protease
MELVCPTGNLPSFKAAVDNGASATYLGFRDDTNARHRSVQGSATNPAAIRFLHRHFDLRRLGIDLLRISPQSRGTARVVETFRACLDGELEPAQGRERLARDAPAGFCDGYSPGAAGIARSAVPARRG